MAAYRLRGRFLPLGSSTPASIAAVSAAWVWAELQCVFPIVAAHFSRLVGGLGFARGLPYRSCVT